MPKPKKTTKIASLSDLMGRTAGRDRDESPTAQLDLKIRELNIKQSERIVEAQARSMGLPYIDLKDFPISSEALSLISRDEAENLGAICFYKTDTEIRIGTTNPQNQEVMELMEQTKQKFPRANITLYVISTFSFSKALKLYDTLPKIREVVKGVQVTDEDIKEFDANSFKNFADLQEKIKNVSMTKIINLIIAASLTMRSSDIHIEAEEQDIVIRYRIDGILHEVARISMDTWTKIIARIKILSGLKINITNRPQDGRFTIFLAKEKVDVRVSTIPTAYGESAVMRLLRSSATSLSFENLGIEGKAHDDLKREIERPNGMIITTGPTGSGKTTTLYAILNKLNNEETKIITLEDPIEYKLPGINQSQITHEADSAVRDSTLTEGLQSILKPTKGYNFADGLRSILRQDPDIIMVGEIRDLETAETAINAALTGHLVISTIHTNSAAAAIPRFLSMGVKPFLLAPALNAVIGQRLCRRICPDCKREITLDDDTLNKVKEILAKIPENSGYKIDWDNVKFYKGDGCESCQGLGFKGRIGIYEIFTMSQEIEKVILSGKVSEYDMQEIAIKQGMITMVQDGLLKASRGITTVDEVFRVSE
jgi:type IV pilus assembly protein PilB